MPDFNVDFSQAKVFILVPRGTYNVHIKAAELGESRRSGNPMIKCQLEIDEVLEQADGAEFTVDQTLGQTLFTNLMLSGEGAGITLGAFTAMFGTDQEGNVITPSSTEELMGAVCSVKVTHRVWAVEDGGDGETRANVSRYYPYKSTGSGAAAAGKLFA